MDCQCNEPTEQKSRKDSAVSKLRTAEFLISNILLHGKDEFDLLEAQRQRLADAEQAIYEVINSLED